MSGGVSHMDTFDPKPALAKYAGQPLTGKGEIVVRQGNPGPLMPSPFTFKKYGQCGMDVSEIFPQIAAHVDELALMRSVMGMSNDHVQAHYALATGMIRMGLPERGVVGDVRAGLGESEPAGLRGDLRCARRSVRRAGELERGLHAGGVSGHGVPVVGLADHRSQAARGGRAGAAARAARSAESS